jgi:hypothetical protein
MGKFDVPIILLVLRTDYQEREKNESIYERGR